MSRSRVRLQLLDADDLPIVSLIHDRNDPLAPLGVEVDNQTLWLTVEQVEDLATICTGVAAEARHGQSE